MRRIFVCRLWVSRIALNFGNCFPSAFTLNSFSLLSVLAPSYIGKNIERRDGGSNPPERTSFKGAAHLGHDRAVAGPRQIDLHVGVAHLELGLGPLR